jgi:hypothetical protein
MRKILATILFLLVASLSLFNVAEAYVQVRGYYKPSINRYVMPHYRTSPNWTKLDNWSTKGNYNPYTGKKGYKDLWSW